MTQDFDSLLKELMEEKYEDIVCPPKEEMWRQLEAMLSLEESEWIREVSKNHTRMTKKFKVLFNYLSSKLKFFSLYLNKKN